MGGLIKIGWQLAAYRESSCPRTRLALNNVKVRWEINQFLIHVVNTYTAFRPVTVHRGFETNRRLCGRDKLLFGE